MERKRPISVGTWEARAGRATDLRADLARRVAERVRRLAAASGLLGLILSASAGAAEFFVSATTGSNTAPGSMTQPWATLQYAADAVGPGDRVTVLPGSYVGFYLGTSGSAASPIEFVAQPGALINQRNGFTPDGINLEGASYIVIDGFAVTAMPRAGVRTVEAEHVTIRNVHAYNNNTWGIFTGFVDDLLIENNETSGSITQHGIYVSNSGDRPVLRGNYAWGNHGAGIQLNADLSSGGDGTITGALLTGNRIAGNAAMINGGAFGGGSGINLDGVVDSRIENNLLYDNHASGISLFAEDGATGSTGNVVINNTIYQPAVSRWALNIQNGSTGNTVRNNIIVTDHPSKGALDISPDSLPGLASDYNVVTSRFTTDDSGTIMTLAQWQAATAAAGAPQDAHSLEALGGAGALFVNPASGDFHLKPGALAIDAGTSLGAPVVDFFGVSRPQGPGFDVGAVESLASSPNFTADFNSDARVDAVDKTVWSGGFGTAAGATRAQGDADADQDVDGRDFLLWQQQRGAGATGAASVPEPATWMLAALCAIAFWRRRS